jgi:rhamnosyl/mannosyltransferase
MPTSQQYLESSPWLQKFRSKCTVVPLGIELHRFSETESIARRADEIRATLARPIILFVGKLRSYKGLHLLVRAMKDVPDAVCVIIGEGYEEEYLHALRNDLELGDRVKFAGELPEQELIAHYFAADIFCLPSHLRSEAFGLSQVEAMACGLPVVSARLATGVPFVNQNGKTGLSVEPGSYEALSVALNALLKDDSLRNQMGVAARERALKLFGADRMCREVISVYRQVLKKA